MWPVREKEIADWPSESGDGSRYLSMIVEEGSQTEYSSPHTATAHITQYTVGT